MIRVMLILSFALATFAEYFPLLPMMYEENSIYYDTYFSGGSALPDKSGGALLNPAATNQWHIIHKSRIASNVNYFKLDDAYFKTGVAVTASFKKTNYIGGEYMYRGDEPNNKLSWQRGSIMYGGQLAPESNQGAVHWGVNLSYINHIGTHALPKKASLDTVDYSYTAINEMHQNLFTLDVGFYQAEVINNLAVSFVFENLVGIQWTNTTTQSYEDTASIPDTLIDTTAIGEKKTTNSWPNKEYNTILLGLAFSVPLWNDNFMLNIPFDVRFWGWLNGDLRDRSHVRARVEYHSGFEFMARLGRGPRLAARLGWAYKPSELATDSKGLIVLNDELMTNYISGGFGVEYRMIRADVLFRKNGWGVGLTGQF